MEKDKIQKKRFVKKHYLPRKIYLHAVVIRITCNTTIKMIVRKKEDAEFSLSDNLVTLRIVKSTKNKIR